MSSLEAEGALGISCALISFVATFSPYPAVEQGGLAACCIFTVFIIVTAHALCIAPDTIDHIPLLRTHIRSPLIQGICLGAGDAALFAATAAIMWPLRIYHLPLLVPINFNGDVWCKLTHTFLLKLTVACSVMTAGHTFCVQKGATWIYMDYINLFIKALTGVTFICALVLV